MQVDKILELIGLDDDSVMSGSLPNAVVQKMLETNTRAAKESAERETMNEVYCRLLASGMTAAEIAMILRVRVDDVVEAEQYGKEKIALYAKQLKGRRRSAKDRQGGGL